MDYLSDAERAEIRSVMSDLKDTFHKKVMSYYRYVGSVSRFNEGEGGTHQLYDIDCMIAYGKMENDRFTITPSGKNDNLTIKVTLNVDYLISLNLWDVDNNVVKFDAGKDYFIIDAKKYYISMPPAYEGFFENRPLHVIILGDPKIKDT